MTTMCDSPNIKREAHHKRLNTLAEAKGASIIPDSTARNSLASPLFSLPIELQKKIFAYAYDDIVVHVHEQYDPTRGSHTIRTALGVVAKPFVYRFYTTNPCWSTGFETGLQRVYRATPLKAPALGTTPLKDSRTPSVSACPDCCTTHPADAAIAKRPNARLPLVSRQFWAEAFPAFLSTLTLQFTCPHVLYDWIRNPVNQDMLKQVRGLEIRMTRLTAPEYGHTMPWAKAAHIVHIAKFENLQGVRLLVQLGRTDALALGENYNVMWDKAWSPTKLPEVIDAFQLGKLDPKRTKVALLMLKDPRPRLPNGPMCEPKDRKLAGVIRQALLDYDPDQ